MSGAEQHRDIRRGVGAHQPIGAAMRESHLLQPIEIAQQLLPFRRDARFAGEIVEMVLHRKRQEGTEHVTADGGVGGVKDRPRAHDRLGAAEEVLDPQQIAIAQHSLQWRYFRIGAQHEDPVEPRLLGELASVDRE